MQRKYIHVFIILIKVSSSVTNNITFPKMFMLKPRGRVWFLSSNTHPSIKVQLTGILGIKCIREHGLYRGLPLRVGRKTRSTFAYLKDKFTNKLISWRGKLLSAGGKGLLIRVVACTIPNYVMSCYSLPKTLCEELQQMCAQFFWGATEEKRTIHWRSWERMCLPKEQGGMGFKCLFAHNKAMLAKLGWIILNNPDSLIARLYKAVYHPNTSFMHADLGEKPSFTWKSILEARPVLEAGLSWRIGTGECVEVWNHSWIPECPAGSLTPQAQDDVYRVADLLLPNPRRWKVDLVGRCFTADIAAKILAISLSSRNFPDRLCWRFTKKGLFSVKSAYVVARNMFLSGIDASPSTEYTYTPIWRGLWRAKIPSKVAIFPWRLVQNLLPTREAISRKGYTGDLRCLMCHNHVETAEHLFYGCDYSRPIVEVPDFGTALPFLRLKDWLLDKVVNLPQAGWEKLLVTLWHIWKSRNEVLWDQKTIPNHQVAVQATAWFEEYTAANAQPTIARGHARRAREVWKPPPENVLRLNVDGAYTAGLPMGGGGGIFRDHRGHMVAGFTRQWPYVASPLQVELLALRTGLEICLTMQLSHVLIGSDCLVAIHSINAREDALDDLSAIRAYIRAILAKNRGYTIAFIRRDANRVAHRLASIGFESPISLDWLV